MRGITGHSPASRTYRRSREPFMAGGSRRDHAGRRFAGPAGGVVLAAAVVAIAPIGLATVVAAAILCAALLVQVGAGAPRRSRRRRLRRRSVPRTAGRALQVAAALVAAAGAVSYARAMARPSNSSVPIRSVEWLRDSGGAGLVSDVERVYYSLTAPQKGGAALRQLPSAGVTATATATATASATATPTPPQIRRRAPRPPAYRPPRLRPVIRPALAGEGVWAATQLRFANDPSPPLLVTTYRPDPNYPRVVAGLAWIDHRRTTVSLYPGLHEPPDGSGLRSAQVPNPIRSKLLASFNSGFKHKDGLGGFVAQGRVYEPLLRGQGTVMGTSGGQVDVLTWTGGAAPAGSVRFARQNLPLIVDGGAPNPALSDGPQWGATLGNAILVWRSGLGIDRRGNLIYAAAPEQTVRGLAGILIHAGAVRAIELDINSYWVTLNTYRQPGGGNAHSLLTTMSRPAQRYLSPDDRDFFAVSLR
jgi:hypothetical protein